MGGGTPVPKTDSTNYGNKTDIKDETVDSFKDMESFEWAESAVNKLFSEGIVSGDGLGYFRPEDNITREEFVKMLVLTFDISSAHQENMTFNDVVSDEWYYPYLQTAFQGGIVKGISEYTFWCRNVCFKTGRCRTYKPCYEAY